MQVRASDWDPGIVGLWERICLQVLAVHKVWRLVIVEFWTCTEFLRPPQALTDSLKPVWTHSHCVIRTIAPSTLVVSALLKRIDCWSQTKRDGAVIPLTRCEYIAVDCKCACPCISPLYWSQGACKHVTWLHLDAVASTCVHLLKTTDLSYSRLLSWI